jgi:FtsP/CotA-like multicopper oxidase with cupredoxin domain
MALAERADLIVDFSQVQSGQYVLGNAGPDEPFGGGEFESADPLSTGEIMQFRVKSAVAADPSTPPQFLSLPAIAPLPAGSDTRPLALLEEAWESEELDFEGPSAALLGVVDKGGMPMGHMWSDAVSENPAVGDTETWEFFNFTADAHPMHVHEVTFEVLDRQELETDDEGMSIMPARLKGEPKSPEPWEAGRKDTVTAYPGQVTRIRAHFEKGGQFVWHCHIVSHEDNEMMRPYRIGPADPEAPTTHPGM